MNSQERAELLATIAEYPRYIRIGDWVNLWRTWPAGPIKKCGTSRTRNCSKPPAHTCSS